MTATTQPVNIKAAATTVVVHILLFLLFIFLSYSTPVTAPVEELGMEVNLGTSDEGSGFDQPMSTDAPSASNVATIYKSAAQQNEETRDLMQSDDPDAPAIAPPATSTNNSRFNSQPSNNQRSRTSERQTNANTNAQPQRPRYVYSASAGPGGNNASTNQPGTNEGNTTGEGDRGVPGGTPGSANYTGSPGNGTGGISHNFSGREISPRQFVAEFNQGGKVVVRVKVNREGNIISKTIKSSPNKRLSDIALQKLSQAKFSKNPDAAPEQIGDITFVFKTRAQ
ncbi:MAG TPA: hypothetical protein PL009_07380 [Flavipsychrobacter sp.]|nr:hypothetical protein [Flavipsychrobacter sp.]